MVAIYTVATNSYVAEQWKYNLGVEPDPISLTGMTVLEAAVKHAEATVLLSSPQTSAVQQVE